jgi:hypothetical protein
MPTPSQTFGQRCETQKRMTASGTAKMYSAGQMPPTPPLMAAARPPQRAAQMHPLSSWNNGRPAACRTVTLIQQSISPTAAKHTSHQGQRPAMPCDRVPSMARPMAARAAVAAGRLPSSCASSASSRSASLFVNSCLQPASSLELQGLGSHVTLLAGRQMAHHAQRPVQDVSAAGSGL